MEAKTIMTADYLDILYDNRNKEYGGYELRKHYNQRMGKSFLFLGAIMGAIICLSFVNRSLVAERYVNPVPVTPTIIDITPKVMPKVIKETTPPPPPAQHVKTKLRTEPIIDQTDNVPDDKQMTRNDEMKNAHPGFSNNESDTADMGISPTKKGGTGNSLATVTQTKEPAKWVEQMPQFAGDMSAFISSHLKYPDAAREQGVDGKVLVQFVVNEDGSVSNATILKGIGGGCNQEALRMVNSMPHWKPGKQNGTPVKVYFTLPILFKLE